MQCVDVDRNRIRARGHRARADLDGHLVEIDRQTEQFLRAEQEVTGESLGVERDYVVAEQPVQQLFAHLGWQHPPRIGAGPRDVHEVRKHHVGAALSDQIGNEVEVIVVQHHQCAPPALFDLADHRVGKEFIDRDVALVESVPFALPDVGRVDEVVKPVLNEPQQRIGDHTVEILVRDLVDLDQPDLERITVLGIGEARLAGHVDVERRGFELAGDDDVFVGGRRAHPHRVIQLPRQPDQCGDEPTCATPSSSHATVVAKRDRRAMGEHDHRDVEFAGVDSAPPARVHIGRQGGRRGLVAGDLVLLR